MNQIYLLQAYECSYKTVLDVPGGGGRLDGALWNFVRMEVLPRKDMVILLELSPSISNHGRRFVFLLLGL